MSTCRARALAHDYDQVPNLGLSFVAPAPTASGGPPAQAEADQVVDLARARSGAEPFVPAPTPDADAALLGLKTQSFAFSAACALRFALAAARAFSARSCAVRGPPLGRGSTLMGLLRLSSGRGAAVAAECWGEAAAREREAERMRGVPEGVARRDLPGEPLTERRPVRSTGPMGVVRRSCNVDRDPGRRSPSVESARSEGERRSDPGQW